MHYDDFCNHLYMLLADGGTMHLSALWSAVANEMHNAGELDLYLQKMQNDGIIWIGGTSVDPWITLR